jgi:aspartate/methionine/tyrosine aminotransferase
MKPTSSRAEIAPFLAMDILARANALEAEGRKIYHLETGQPATPAPNAALVAARDALAGHTLGYTEALGIPPLRQAIAQTYRDRYGLGIDPRRVIVTTGSSAGFILSFLAAFDAGQRLVMGTPSYPAYRNTALALNVLPVGVPAGLATGFQLPLDVLEQIDGAHGLLIASPANPTGTVIPGHELESIAGLCRSKRWRLIADEIYHGLSYGVETPSVLSFAPDAIVVNSFSKYYSMTGWRIGWMIVPETMVRTVERLAQNLFISPPAISQFAALGALTAEARTELDGHVKAYWRNRNVLAMALKAGGISSIAPGDGAFYLYAHVGEITVDSRVLASELLSETGVAATPGWDFDPDGGGAWLRLSYAGAESDIREASGILSSWLAHRPRR